MIRQTFKSAFASALSLGLVLGLSQSVFSAALQNSARITTSKSPRPSKSPLDASADDPNGEDSDDTGDDTSMNDDQDNWRPMRWPTIQRALPVRRVATNWSDANKEPPKKRGVKERPKSNATGAKKNEKTSPGKSSKDAKKEIGPGGATKQSELHSPKDKSRSKHPAGHRR